jgi:hypothetical protein
MKDISTLILNLLVDSHISGNQCCVPVSPSRQEPDKKTINFKVKNLLYKNDIGKLYKSCKD